MIDFRKSTRKRITVLLLVIWIFNLLVPTATYALTSGPSQPEMQSFQPAGVTDMVDLSTGNFKYNVPLLDIEGYPVNLNYQSGVSMDDEASWVGLGWNLNIGAINRELRGIPDDFSGENIVTEHYTKPKITVGGRLSGKVEIAGKGVVKGKASVSLGVFSDSYTGIGAEFGANAGITASFLNEGSLTAGLGLGILSNTSSGVDFSPYTNLAIRNNAVEKTVNNPVLTLSGGINTRSGAKDLTLGASFTKKMKGVTFGFSPSMSVLSYNTPAILPSINIPYESSLGSFSMDAGPAEVVVFGGVGVTGYKSVKRIVSETFINKGYGFLYSERAKNDKDGVMDFIREKDNPVIPELPNLALPVHTPDVFTYTSQLGSGQFRLYRSTGAFGDSETEENSENSTAGFDLGIGVTNLHVGYTFFDQNSGTITRKWKNNNYFLKNGDFQDYSAQNPHHEHVYFKVAGEKTLEDSDRLNQIKNTSALAVNIYETSALSSVRDEHAVSSVINNLSKNKREYRKTALFHLTAEEAVKGALDTAIIIYPLNNSATFKVNQNHQLSGDSSHRVADMRKPHHLSEITVTNEQGGRTVYGLPVYNNKQEEYTFSIGRQGTYSASNGNQVDFSVNGERPVYKHNKTDHYYHKTIQPAYASTFLLTGILSSDYADKTGNGISSDDNGTAIKFNYSKLGFLYRWRTPYGANKAILNKGQLADPDDDKANIVYGEKEIYYVHSIESKNRIAYFILTDREDGLGVIDWKGAINTTNKQKRLSEIRLYSKGDTLNPIKVVKFDYDYELSPNTPNSIASGQGKLTLKKVWFEYGNSTKGRHHPYEFTYYTKVNNQTVNYSNLSTDRWGLYKPASDNPGGLLNDMYPYNNQENYSVLSERASLWHLKGITLPTGGKININYESDDYAYVQNKKAMEWKLFEGLINSEGTIISTNKLSEAKGIRVKLSELPEGENDLLKWFKRDCLSGSDYLYTKLYIKLSTNYYTDNQNQDYDYVPVYCKVTQVNIASGTDKTVNVFFEEISDKGIEHINPISIAAWQRLKNEYPMYAYPGYINRAGDGDANKSVERAIKAIVSSVGNLSELSESFYKKANRKNFAQQYDPSKSFVRLTKQNGKKYGGGSRVNKIQISDEWNEMTGAKVKTANYGQVYEYIKTEDGKQISSGVASNEPFIGADENVLKQPLPYIQKIKGAVNNFFSLEEPFGESFYPGPAVIYSKITIKDIDQRGNAQGIPETGFVVHEFYTAREFPVKTKVLDIQRISNQPKKIYNFLMSSSIDELTLSQGYQVMLNDMHGKPKAVYRYNRQSMEVASTVYHYNAVNTGAGELELSNKVSVINENGTVSHNKVIGRDIDFFTDIREQEVKNEGLSINSGSDFIRLGFITVPLPHFPKYDNNDYRLFRSICAVKVVQYYGVLDKVVETNDGTMQSTENIAYDAITGEPLVTRTQNEFENYIYNVNLPAYWVYKGMGGAYQNLGMILINLSTLSDGSFNSYNQHLFEGDEVYDVENQMKYWVINTNSKKRLINKHGRVQSSLVIPTAKIIRSGYRNLLSKETSSLVCMENPIESGLFRLSASGNMTDLLKVISATVNLYDDKWVAYEQDPDMEEDMSRDFSYLRSANFSNGYYATEMYGYPSITTGNTYIASSYWGGYNYSNNTNYYNRINDVGIWPADDGNPGFGSSNKFGFDTVVNVPSSKIYYLALATNTSVRVNIDCQPTNVFFDCSNCTVYNWKIYPIYLDAGKHVFNFNFLIKSRHANDYGASDTRFAAVELYNNTSNEIKNANSAGTGLNILFTSKNLPGRRYVNSFFLEENKPIQYRYTKKGYGLHACDRDSGPVKGTVNPYLNNFSGNWRIAETKIYQENKEYAVVFKGNGQSIQNKAVGYINNYYNYWVRNAQIWDVNTSTTNWVSPGNITLYNKKGEELENRDALGRYSSALFSFNEELPNAVASNARNREVFVNSFEDNHINFNNVRDTASVRHLRSVADNVHVNNYVVKTNSHTGHYSLKLEPGQKVLLNTQIHDLDHRTENYLGLSDKSEYMFRDVRLIKGLYPVGFEPKSNSKYVFTAWIREPGYLYGKNVNKLNVVVNNSNINLKCKAIVEGWKLVEGIFTTENVGKIGLKMESLLVGSEALLIDDVRIHPYNSHLKSYVYDDKNFKLMAELDENSFATFYEYDDEGILVRVKKETEKGIVMLKETRSSYRKR